MTMKILRNFYKLIMKNIILCFGVILTLANCTSFVVKKNVIANYYLIASDVPEDMILSYYAPNAGDNYEEIIPSTLYAVGYNTKYIIAKQHPRTFPKPADTTIINYYIVPIKANSNTSMKETVIGPLTVDKFNEKCKALNISKELTFTDVVNISE